MLTIYLTPHIDDIVIGAFSFIHNDKDTKVLIHTTDDMPDSKFYPDAYKYYPVEGYKDILDQEKKILVESLAIKKSETLSIQDGNTFHKYDYLRTSLIKILKTYQPDRVIFPTLEGGNLDHELLSYAIRSLKHIFPKTTLLYEYAVYHKRGNDFIHNEFSYGSKNKMELNHEVLKEKISILKKLETKKADLQWFLNDKYESIRLLEDFDINIKPHSDLIYEQMSKVDFGQVTNLVSQSYGKD